MSYPARTRGVFSNTRRPGARSGVDNFDNGTWLAMAGGTRKGPNSTGERMSSSKRSVVFFIINASVLTAVVACGIERDPVTDELPAAPLEAEVQQSLDGGPAPVDGGIIFDGGSGGGALDNPNWSGWSFWTDAHPGEGFSYRAVLIAHPTVFGASCVRVSGDFNVNTTYPLHGHKFGIARTFSGNGRLRGTLTYRARSATSSSQVTNFAFDVVRPDGVTVRSQWGSSGGTTDTGYRTINIPPLAVGGTAEVRLTLSDNWAVNWGQSIDICWADIGFTVGSGGPL
jgi:hypothetical protein